jgi:hypothetical protein
VSPKKPLVVGMASAMLAGGCVSSAGMSRGGAEEPGDLPLHALPNVAGARELDREGVQLFREGRFSDAARYFQAAYRLGGPSSELWNVARTRERLDDAEGACGAIDAYLAQRDLSPPDRAEAEREGRALRARPSVLTVTTTPAGAFLTIDSAQVAGPTPMSLEVSPGVHTIVVRREGSAAETRRIEARFGRAIVVSLDLVGARK